MFCILLIFSSRSLTPCVSQHVVGYGAGRFCCEWVDSWNIGSETSNETLNAVFSVEEIGLSTLSRSIMNWNDKFLAGLSGQIKCLTSIIVYCRILELYCSSLLIVFSLM